MAKMEDLVVKEEPTPGVEVEIQPVSIPLPLPYQSFEYDGCDSKTSVATEIPVRLTFN